MNNQIGLLAEHLRKYGFSDDTWSVVATQRKDRHNNNKSLILRLASYYGTKKYLKDGELLGAVIRTEHTIYRIAKTFGVHKEYINRLFTDMEEMGAAQRTKANTIVFFIRGFFDEIIPDTNEPTVNVLRSMDKKAKGKSTKRKKKPSKTVRRAIAKMLNSNQPEEQVMAYEAVVAMGSRKGAVPRLTDILLEFSKYPTRWQAEQYAKQLAQSFYHDKRSSGGSVDQYPSMLEIENHERTEQ